MYSAGFCNEIKEAICDCVKITEAEYGYYNKSIILLNAIRKNYERAENV